MQNEKGKMKILRFKQSIFEFQIANIKRDLKLFFVRSFPFLKIGKWI